ncbi:hypothetical protein HQ587_02415 [bacterium]|nr:hypothetical protein [bacterium]
MKIQAIKYCVVIVLTLLVALSGCIEHSFNIRVLRDESIDVLYLARGDLMDFDDDRQLMPDSTLWNVRSWIEQGDEERTQNFEARLTISDLSGLNEKLDWQCTEKDSLHLRRDLSIERIAGIFGIKYHFTGIIYSRNFNNLYSDIWEFVPPECKALESDDLSENLTSMETEILEEKFALGIIQWNINRYIRRFDRVWHTAVRRSPDLADISEATFSIGRAGWSEDLHQYLNELDIGDPSMLDLDWWSDLRPVFLGRLIDITGYEKTNLFSRIGDAIEREYQITKDNEDDMFRFNVVLPGKITSSNGVKDENEGINWEFSGNVLQNEDGVMTATSFVLSIWRVVAACLLLVVILSLLRRIFRKS